MSSEPAEARRNKRIVEYIISGFKRADDAVTFGNTLEVMIAEATGKQLFQLSLASPDTMLAITKDWTEDTVLKASWRELDSQHISSHITDIVHRAVSNRNKLYPDKIKIEQEIVREKPQPQFMAIDYIPITSRVNKL